MLSYCNFFITSQKGINELNPSKLARISAIEDSEFKTNASVGRLALEALNFKTTIFKRVLTLTFESLNFRKLLLIELSEDFHLKTFQLLNIVVFKNINWIQLWRLWLIQDWNYKSVIGLISIQQKHWAIAYLSSYLSWGWAWPSSAPACSYK